MTIRRVATFSLLLAAAACAPAAQNARTQIAPKDGPNVSLYATYSGGLFDRNVYAYFNVDRPAYVMIAHLSGEGVIEVLYPRNARDTAKVAARKSLRTPSFFAPYDGVPMLYAMRGLTPIRDFSARINSYDGRGHAYIFAIASDVPLHFEDISESGLWNDVDVPNYMWNPDPRRSIRDFADAVARGAPYTLRFANSYQTTTFTSYADVAWTCSVLASFSWSALYSLGFYRGGNSWYCSGGAGAYSLLDTYWFRFGTPYDGRYVPTFAFTPTPATPRRPDTTATPSPPAGMPTVELLPTQKRVHTAERVRLLGDAEEEFSQPNRTELTTSRTLVAPRRAAADADDSPIDRFDRRPITHEYTPRSAGDAPRWERSPSRGTESPRTERAERQVERAERPAAPAPRAERPQVERTVQPSAPAPRAQPASEPRSEPAPHPRPPGAR